jgi:hypothetical protein
VAALAQRISPANGRLSGRLRPRWDIGLIRHRFDGNSVGGSVTGGRVHEIRMFFVFIDFQRKSPPPTVIAGARDCGNGWLAATARAAPTRD